MVVVSEPLPRVARLISSDSVPVGGFAPGVILADRYRIIGLLGRGGMGEVYRADDVKLSQAVALKFLPKALADDPVRRERFFAEVRIARQLAHPNVCRVYDISEYEARHFLSMEYSTAKISHRSCSVSGTSRTRRPWTLPGNSRRGCRPRTTAGYCIAISSRRT
jgi:serine/threonine protein kinase